MSDSLRIIFAGTSDFSARHLEALLQSSHDVIAVFTQPDRPSGRGNPLNISKVKKLAQQNNLPVFQPHSMNEVETWENIKYLNADIIVVVAYSHIFPKEVLSLSRLGCINVHASLLPRWRGAAPVQRALWAGDRQTGVTVIQMDTNIDTGVILYQSTCHISKNDTSATLFEKLSKIGPSALLITLEQLTSGNSTYFRQNETLVTYADKLHKGEARINWNLPAYQLERCIRAFNPWPVSYFLINGKIIKIWKSFISERQYPHMLPGTVLSVSKEFGIDVSTGDGVLTLIVLQPEGKKAIFFKDFLNSSYRQWFIEGKILN